MTSPFLAGSLSRRTFLTTTAAGTLAATLPAVARAGALTPDAARAIAIDAYIYGYSLVTTDVTRLQMSNVAAIEELRAPLGAFFNIRGYPPATYRGVSATNADTLYSVAWLDLKEPMVFSHPEVPDRFFTFELVDLWMTVHASVGTNTSGSAAKTYLFTGPGWTGAVPEGMIHMPMPTRYMVVLGRTYALNTPEDLAKVHVLQDQYKVVPLASFGKPFTFVAPPVNPDPGVPMREAPQKAILALGLKGYFDWMTGLMGTIAMVPAEDAPMIARMAEIGLVPGKPFNPDALDPAVRAALADVPAIALKRMNAAWASLGTDRDGWRVTTVGGRYGTDYLERGAWASNGWPSQLPEVSVYPTTYVDGTGKPLDGSNRYTLTFRRGALPPVNPRAFWSITMYMIDDGLWFYPNALNKLTVSPRDALKFNPDGSLTLYFQHESPGAEHEANWLPAPDAPFALTMRLYWPDQTPPSILDGTWAPPPVLPAA